MKNIVIFSILVLTSLTLVAQNREIKFETSSFETVKAKAKKPINTMKFLSIEKVKMTKK